jgi:hypothetical protein
VAKASREGMIRGRAPWETLFAADPLHPGWEDVLYERQALSGHYDPVEDERVARMHGPSYAEWTRHGRLRAEGLLSLVSGEPLSSETRRAFALDGAPYASVRAFYDSLKVDDLVTRARIAACAYDGPKGLIARPSRATFRCGAHLVAVGSVEHCVLVARATEAKVQAHEDVRRALLATKRARLYMGAVTALGRAMPFALMVVRERLR